jgi:hypothetical protein
MQPRVDDEEEEGPPPPPPAHRSGLVQPSQQLVPSPASSYKAYSPEFAPSPRNTNDLTAVQPLRPSHGNRLQDHPRMKNPSVPRSLVAGFDPAVAEAEAARAAQESQANRRRSFFEEDAMIRTAESKPASVPYPDETDPRRSLVLRKSVSSESRIVPRRKSVSPRPPSTAERQVSQIPFSPDSYDALNPNAARSAVTRDTAPAYETVAQAMQTARLNEMKPDTSGPIIGDDGREIDPSDHLPSDTWAPEPERKNRKPEVILRFKHPSAREVAGPRPRSSGTSPVAEYPERGRPEYGGYGHGRNYSTTDTARPRSSHRKSVSPAPSARSSHSVSSLYANVGPPIPAKVPIAPPAGPSYPVMGGHTGMDALSRELNSIDLGSVGCSVVRAPRKYVPKTITYAV